MAAKNPRLLFRLGGLLFVIAIGVVLIGFPVAEKRTERRVRTMLLAVQEGLQRYHVKEERYPKTMMAGRELVSYLAEFDFLEKTLANPWTGSPFLANPEDDWLRYRTNSLAETYELIVYFPGTEEVQFRLDSTENQSLE